MVIGKNQVFQNFISFHQFFSNKITPHFNFCPKNDGLMVIFSFLLQGPSKTSEALKIFWGPQKRPIFWILDLWVCLKKLGLESGLYGKSVLYLKYRWFMLQKYMLTVIFPKKLHRHSLTQCFFSKNRLDYLLH